MNVADTTQTYKPIAMRAILDYRAGGVALRDETGRVFFCEDGTGRWTEMYDRDAARLQLLGRVDLIRAMEIQDGDLVVKASRTLQARRAA